VTTIGPRDALGIARRAIANLDLIKQQHETNSANGHVVTQIVSTSLAVLVLPWDDWLDEDSDLIHMVANGESWTVDDRTGSQRSDDLRYLRHALAHGGISFDSDSREPSEVEIRFWSRPTGGAINWRAAIQADELEDYLRRLFIQLEDRLD
jgi:hypothetical protein